jgi:hypothetical protein
MDLVKNNFKVMMHFFNIFRFTMFRLLLCFSLAAMLEFFQFPVICEECYILYTVRQENLMVSKLV